MERSACIVAEGRRDDLRDVPAAISRGRSSWCTGSPMVRARRRSAPTEPGAGKRRMPHRPRSRTRGYRRPAESSQHETLPRSLDREERTAKPRKGNAANGRIDAIAEAIEQEAVASARRRSAAACLSYPRRREDWSPRLGCLNGSPRPNSSLAGGGKSSRRAVRPAAAKPGTHPGGMATHDSAGAIWRRRRGDRRRGG